MIYLSLSSLMTISMTLSSPPPLRLHRWLLIHLCPILVFLLYPSIIFFYQTCFSRKMDSGWQLQLWSSSSLVSLSFLFIVVSTAMIPLSLCYEDLFSNCSGSFSCGNINNIGFPFWGEIRPYGCGHPRLKLGCERSSVATMGIMNVTYRVLDVNTNIQTIKISREDYLTGICSPKYVNSTLDSTLFDLSIGYQNLTLFYGCSTSSSTSLLPVPGVFSCHENGDVQMELAGSVQLPSNNKCNQSVVIPINTLSTVGNLLDKSKLEEIIREGFEVKWKVDSANCSDCMGLKGVCGFDLKLNQSSCYNSPVKPESRLSWWLILTIGLAGITVVSFVIIYGVKRGYLSNNSMVWWKRDHAKNDHFMAKEILRNFESMAPKRYNYSEVKKMTNSFKNEVGQGGHGVVYKGELADGRIVAVKVLGESKGNGEGFRNEVTSISRTSHVNIVTLLGFCYEKTKRALIYEFVPNGSLDKFINDKGSSITNCQLNNNIMFQIAVGIARGLEYLHRGCRTKILHFDIKPHNILLDENLCPKISDFGLAKLCKTKESIVSTTSMRGTVGFIAPEVFSRYFGRVSHKSDVYSYGMLVLEMVAGRKNLDDGVLSHSSEKCFPNWIYDKLEKGETNDISGDINTDYHDQADDMINRMIIVSLWCIQTNPLDRPSMSKVIEMLECNFHELPQFPPKPVLNSPRRLAQHSSIGSTTTS